MYLGTKSNRYTLLAALVVAFIFAIAGCRSKLVATVGKSSTKTAALDGARIVLTLSPVRALDFSAPTESPLAGLRIMAAAGVCASDPNAESVGCQIAIEIESTSGLLNLLLNLASGRKALVTVRVLSGVVKGDFKLSLPKKLNDSVEGYSQGTFWVEDLLAGKVAALSDSSGVASVEMHFNGAGAQTVSFYPVQNSTLMVTVSGLLEGQKVTIRDEGLDESVEFDANETKVLSRKLEAGKKFSTIVSATQVAVSSNQLVCSSESPSGTATAEGGVVSYRCQTRAKVNVVTNFVTDSLILTEETSGQAIDVFTVTEFAQHFQVGSIATFALGASPANYTCSLDNASVTVQVASTVNVSCTRLTTNFDLTVVGLPLSESFTVRENGTNQSVSLTGNGVSSLLANVPRGDSWSLTVASQSAGTACTIDASSGNASAAVIPININCVPRYALMVEAAGLLPGSSIWVREASLGLTHDLVLTRAQPTQTFAIRFVPGALPSITVQSGSGVQNCEIASTIKPMTGSQLIMISCANTVFLASGTTHSCAINDLGEVRCWGRNTSGELGTGDLIQRDNPNTRPVDLGIGRTAKSIALGSSHTCAILDNDSVKCWGWNYYGQLGQGNTVSRFIPTSVDLGIGRTAKQIGLGSAHTCAVLDNDTLKCWGLNDSGQLGTGNVTNVSTPTLINLGVGRTSKMVTSGYYHTCAILDDDSVKCWGRGDYGHLGAGNFATVYSPTTTLLGSGRTAKQIDAGSHHTCALLDDNSVKCWGYNFFGQIGNGNTTNITTPANADLGVGRSAKLVTAGIYQSCAILDDDSLKCWGYNNAGQLGTGDLLDRINPTLVDPWVGQIPRQLTLGQSFSCALFDNSSVRCWGATGSGLLGTGNVSVVSRPSAVGLGSSRTAKSVALGAGHSCSVLDDDSLKCWGYGGQGQLGTGSSVDSPMPSLVNLGVGRFAIQTALGGNHSCAVLDDNSVKCWGSSSNGQIGTGVNGTSYSSPVSVNLGVGRTAKQVALGQMHSCAILDIDEIKCWGWNGYGQLGIGTILDAFTPVSVNLGVGRTAKSVALASLHTCAILDDESLKCWGYNGDGRLGTGDTTSTNIPVNINLGTGRTIKKLSLSSSSACAILDNGMVKCWGNSQYTSTPTSIDLGAGRMATQISVGGAHTCALLDNSLLKCWGSGISGQLGTGNLSSISSPTIISFENGRTAKQMSLGQSHSCAILDDDNLRCWGSNTLGQTGISYRSIYGLTGSSVSVHSLDMASVAAPQTNVSDYIMKSIDAQPLAIDLWSTVRASSDELQVYLSSLETLACDQASLGSWTAINTWTKTSDGKYVLIPNSGLSDETAYRLCLKVKPEKAGESDLFLRPASRYFVDNNFSCGLGTFSAANGQCTCSFDPNSHMTGGGYRNPCSCSGSVWNGSSCDVDSFDCGAGSNDGTGNCTCYANASGGGNQAACGCDPGYTINGAGSSCDLDGASYDCGDGFNDGSGNCSCKTNANGGGFMTACSCDSPYTGSNATECTL